MWVRTESCMVIEECGDSYTLFPPAFCAHVLHPVHRSAHQQQKPMKEKCVAFFS